MWKCLENSLLHRKIRSKNVVIHSSFVSLKHVAWGSGHLNFQKCFWTYEWLQQHRSLKISTTVPLPQGLPFRCRSLNGNYLFFSASSLHLLGGPQTSLFFRSVDLNLFIFMPTLREMAHTLRNVVIGSIATQGGRNEGEHVHWTSFPRAFLLYLPSPTSAPFWKEALTCLSWKDGTCI